MLEAGYTKAMAKNPYQILQTIAVQEGLQPTVERMITHREKVITKMEEKIDKAHYNQLTDALDKLTKNIQLLSGGSTENIFQITWKK